MSQTTERIATLRTSRNAIKIINQAALRCSLGRVALWDAGQSRTLSSFHVTSGLIRQALEWVRPVRYGGFAVKTAGMTYIAYRRFTPPSF